MVLIIIKSAKFNVSLLLKMMLLRLKIGLMV